MRLRHHRVVLFSMSSKIQCYLRTLRLQWGLTQEELASLLPKGSRNRVSFVERGLARPNAQEILAYPLIFGEPGHAIFRKLAEDVDEEVMRRAYRLYKALEKRREPAALRRRQLLDGLRERAIKNARDRRV